VEKRWAKKEDGPRKQPYYIHFEDGRPLVFAALYDSWQNSEGVFFFFHIFEMHLMEDYIKLIFICA